MPTGGHEHLFCKRGVQKAIERNHPIGIAGSAGHFHWHRHSVLVTIFCDGIATMAEYDILSQLGIQALASAVGLMAIFSSE